MLLLVLLLLLVITRIIGQIEPWKLPHLPTNPPRPVLGDKSCNKLIPRHLWIAVRDLSQQLGPHMTHLFERNKNWDIHVTSNEMKDEFMNKTFANTSLLWAYHLISPAAMAAKADLWRYAILWTYGGVYIDDDSDMGSPLDEVVEANDTLIVAYEKNGFNGNRCYIPRYHLSDFATFRNESKKDKLVFHGRVLLNWAMASAPRHKIIEATIANSIEIIRHEYFQDPVMRSLNFEYKWAAIMCSTGPSLLTASAREIVLKDLPDVTYKLADVDFRNYGGKFKTMHTPKNGPDHYMKRLQLGGKANMLLSEYLPEQPVTQEQLKEWQGQAIQAQNGKEIFVIDHGKKRGIPNWDTFVGLNFTMADVIVLSDHKMSLIPKGETMPSLMTRR